MGYIDKIAATIAHDHIYGNNDIEAIVFMNKRLGRLDLQQFKEAQTTLYKFGS